MGSTSLSYAAPVIPEELRRAGVTGPVAVEVTIERSGVVSSARAIQGAEVLRPVAVEAVMKWKYEKPLLGSDPVRITMIVVVLCK